MASEPIVPRLDFGDDTQATDPSNAVDFADGPMPDTMARSNQTNISAEQRRLHYLYQEYAAIAKDPIEGVYVTPSVSNPFEWSGVLIVRTGIYCGGMFRFTLTLPNDFPDTTTMPIVRFEDNLFHPLIDARTRVADFGRYFPSGWQRDRNHVYQLLAAVQGMFFRCKTDEPARAPNPEAALLIRDEMHKFKQLARETVRQSRTQIYGSVNSDNAIHFTPWDVELEPFREFVVGRISVNDLAARFPRAAAIVTSAGPVASAIRKKRCGFSWIDIDHCQYMCDVFPAASPVSKGAGFIKIIDTFEMQESNKSTSADTSAEL